MTARTTKKDVRYFALLCVVLGGMGQGVVAPNLPILLQDAASLALWSGLSGTVMYFGIFLTTFQYGKLADRGNFNWILSGGLFGYAACLFLLGEISSPVTLVIVRFLEGLALSAVFVAADFALGRLSPTQERGKWLSFYGVALSLGLLLGPLVSLMAARTLAFFHLQEPWMESPTLPLFLVGTVALALAIFALPLKISAIKTSSRKKPKLNPRALLVGATYGFMESGLVAVFPVLAVEHFLIRPEYCLIVVILAAAASSLGWGIYSDRRGPQSTLRILLLSLGMGSLALIPLSFITTSETSAILTCLFFGALAGGLYPVGFNWLLESVSPAHYGHASGGFARSYGLGSLLGPLACGFAAHFFQANGVFILLAAAGSLTYLAITVDEKTSDLQRRRAA